MSLQIYKKYNWQHVIDELAIRTACEKGRRTGPRALQHVLYLTHCGRGQHNILKLVGKVGEGAFLIKTVKESAQN